MRGGALPRTHRDYAVATARDSNSVRRASTSVDTWPGTTLRMFLPQAMPSRRNARLATACSLAPAPSSLRAYQLSIQDGLIFGHLGRICDVRGVCGCVPRLEPFHGLDVTGIDNNTHCICVAVPVGFAASFLPQTFFRSGASGVSGPIIPGFPSG